MIKSADRRMQCFVIELDEDIKYLAKPQTEIEPVSILLLCRQRIVSSEQRQAHKGSPAYQIHAERAARLISYILFVLCVCVASERASCYNCMLCAGVFLSRSFAARRFACDAQQQHESKLIIFADRPLPRIYKNAAQLLAERSADATI